MKQSVAHPVLYSVLTSIKGIFMNCVGRRRRRRRRSRITRMPGYFNFQVTRLYLTVW